MIHRSRRIALAASFFAVAALAACSDNTTAPVSAVKAVGNRSSVVAGFLHSNSQRYSDHGAKPATGRSGTAAVEARALLGKDGGTVVEASTGSVGGVPVTGTFSKIQVKTFALDNSKSNTSNYNALTSGTWTQSYAGLARNERIQLQSNVRNQDGKRTDVVTVETQIKRRPDLAASNLSGPASSYVNAVVNFSATVTELNGDVGASANCVLFVDGVQADQVNGLWVDAGDAISCAFAKTFATVGTKSLKVVVSDVSPSDWDVTNNSAEASIEIVEPSVRLNYQFQGYTHSYDYTSRNWYSNSYYSYYGYSYDRTETGHSDYSQVNFSGWSNNRGAQFPLQAVDASVTSDQGNILSLDMSNGVVYDNGVGSCWVRNSDGLSAQICTYNWGGGNSQTNVWFNRWGGVTTYYSVGFDQYWDYYYGYSYTNSWSYNGVNTWGNGAFFNVNTNTLAFDVKVVDATGTMFKASASGVTGQSYPINYNYSYCYNYYWYYGNQCYSYLQAGTQKSFWAQEYINN